jgi:hypothetical protein
MMMSTTKTLRCQASSRTRGGIKRQRHPPGSEDFQIVFGGPSKKERELLVGKCIHGLQSDVDRDFYQAVAAAKYVGGDKRLVRPLFQAFRSRRGWKRNLALEAIRYLGITSQPEGTYLSPADS